MKKVAHVFANNAIWIKRDDVFEETAYCVGCYDKKRYSGKGTAFHRLVTKKNKKTDEIIHYCPVCNTEYYGVTVPKEQ
jgi:hypothetical protein